MKGIGKINRSFILYLGASHPLHRGVLQAHRVGCPPRASFRRRSSPKKGKDSEQESRAEVE